MVGVQQIEKWIFLSTVFEKRNFSSSKWVYHLHWNGVEQALSVLQTNKRGFTFSAMVSFLRGALPACRWQLAEPFPALSMFSCFRRYISYSERCVPKNFQSAKRVEGQEALSSAWVETLYRSIFLDQHGWRLTWGRQIMSVSATFWDAFMRKILNIRRCQDIMKRHF